MTLTLWANSQNFTKEMQNVLSMKRESASDVRADVSAIIADVTSGKDASLCALTSKFDRFTVTPETLRITEAEIEEASKGISDEVMQSLTLAADRIRAFHSKQLPDTIDYTDDAGVRLGQRWTAVSAAGMYVPGGLASYPSSVLMNAIPATVAGVKRLVMTVPTPDGKLSPLVLAAAKLAGVTEIYRVGGAQAVAALAFGTETIQSVDKIVGPGNAYVAEAKRQVFGKVGIDAIAGPSEILVVADNKNDPSWIAADLLSQAEHDTAAQSILITDDADYAKDVEQAIHDHLQSLPKRDIALQSWTDYGVIIIVDDVMNSAPIIDQLAPEHLELAIEEPNSLMDMVHHAGAIFLGRYTPEAIGDYVAGPNHVLPTARSPRFSSGLSVYDFMKRTTFVACDEASLNAIGPAAVCLAGEEGLDAHALSVSIRLNENNSD